MCASERCRRILATAVGRLLGVGACLIALAGVPPALSQTQNPAPSPAPAQSQPAPETVNASELTTRDTSTSFKVKTHLVLVRVVVRDAKGQIVSGLKKEDFRVFDNRKPQVIANFGVETSSAKPSVGGDSAGRGTNAEAPASPEAPPVMPKRYLALYFDDVHLMQGDLIRSREAAERQMVSGMVSGDRVGIFTSSGRAGLDFTDDRKKLHEILFQLIPRPIVPTDNNDCPNIDYFMADQIVNQNDSTALSSATQETLECEFNNDPRFLAQAAASANAAAIRALHFGDEQTQYALRELEKLVRRLEHLPGQRNIVMVSPGFHTPTQQFDLDLIVDRALRSNIIISAVDARGLWAPNSIDEPENHVLDAGAHGRKEMFKLQGYGRTGDVLAQLSDSTGGYFFHNNNDLDSGFRRVGALPEEFYILGFVPEGLKFDGRFHTLKVSLATSNKWTVQARRGYFAPKKAEDPAIKAKEEIEEAIFSQDEMNELPIAVHTQFFKSTQTDAQISVLTRVDVRALRFRKEEGRNRDDLTLVAALFDRDGNLLEGKEKQVEFRLRDPSLEQLQKSGITMKTSFDVKPGTYLVRLVVRDAGGAQIAAMNRTVEIP